MTPQFRIAILLVALLFAGLFVGSLHFDRTARTFVVSAERVSL